MMKKIFSITLVVVLFGCKSKNVIFEPIEEEPENEQEIPAKEELSKNDTIYFFGNSITFGARVSPSGNRYSSVLVTKLGVNERNFGISSSLMTKDIPASPLGAKSMQDTLSAIPVKTPNRKLIMISYGVNDVGSNRTNYDTIAFKRDYRTALDTMLARGWKTENILIVSPFYLPDSAYRRYATLNGGQGIPTRQRHLDFVDASEQLAMEYGTLYKNIYTAIEKNQPATLYTADSTHPNVAGHRLIADTLFQFLKTKYKVVK